MYCSVVCEMKLKNSKLVSIFTDSIIASNCEAVGFLLSGLLYRSYRAKPFIIGSLIGSCLLAAVAIGVPVDNKMFPLIFMAIKVCMGVCFNALLLIAFDSFGIVYMATVFGVQSVVARVIGFLAILAENLQQPMHLGILSCFCLCTTFICGFKLNERKE